MTLERLNEILDAYGADPERWPAEERQRALAFLTRSAEARARLDAAAHLDHVLDALPAPPPPSLDLESRITAMAPARGSRRRWMVPPLAAAAALAIWVLRSDGPSVAPDPTVPMARLGVYETTTDSLLDVDGLDLPGANPRSDPDAGTPNAPRFLPSTDPVLTTDTKRMHA